MSEIEAHGLAVDLPAGWEGRVFRRAEAGEVQAAGVVGASAPPGELTFPVVHVASIPIPNDAADYGSDLVESLGPDDAFIVLKEFEPADATQPLFARAGMPELAPEDFDPAGLQRQLSGQAGRQEFFHEAGRAFCVYVVLGSYSRRNEVVPAVNAVLAGIRIDPGAAE
ncbi:MAG: hypothetical protein WEA75_00020 [Acidimicrobiia bacterium]